MSRERGVTFLPHGPEIPHDLLRAQMRGEAVFLCGAGVSRTVGLPGFRDLVQLVYRGLNEHWVGHPAESREMDRDGGAFDRVLFALQVRLAGIDAQRMGQVGRSIVDLAAVALRTPDGDLPHHAAILRLSRGADTRPRVVTTNFDTLFEAAWARAGHRPLVSHASASLPQPGSGAFEGVLHLHGRLDDESLGLARSDLVLTSAEFGDAYLRSGWAARYVYDLARTSTVVIVGYGADDPPMRYLLDLLTADRSRFADLRPIFAFVDAASGAERRAKEAEWAMRGTVPIVYDAPSHDHGALYDTLAVWADMAGDSARWRAETSAELLSRPPDQLADHEWSQIERALGDDDAARLIEAADPSPEWLPPLRSRVLGDRPAAILAPWIAGRVAERAMLDQVIEHDVVDDHLSWLIDRALADAAVPEAMRKVWRLVSRPRVTLRWTDGWRFLLARATRGETGYDVQAGVAGLLRPWPKASKAFRWREAGDEADRVSSFAWVRFKPRDYVNPDELLRGWPPDRDEPLLRRLLRTLLDALEEAAQLEDVNAGYDGASADVSSVARHPQDSLPDHGFYPIVRTVADFGERLAATRPELVRAIFEPLAGSAFALPRRLRLHALTFRSVYGDEAIAPALLALEDEAFWSSELRRESMRLMAERWGDVPAVGREAVEARLSGGMPIGMFHDDAAPELVAAIRDHEAFIRLARLAATTAGLGPVGQEAMTRIRARHPDWEASPGDRDDFGSWSESRVGEQGDPDLLRDVPIERLVAEAGAIAERSPFDQGEIWRKYARADPARALDGLVAQGGQGSAGHWRAFLWALAEAGTPDLTRRTVAFLAAAPDELVAGVTSAAASWLDRSFDEVIAAHDGDYAGPMALWDRLAAQLEQEMADEAAPIDDPMMAVLNRSPGHLASALVAELRRREPDERSGLPDDLAPRFHCLSELEGAAGLTALAGLMLRLPYLHRVDPEWAEAALVPRLDWSDPWADGLWLAYAYNRWLGTVRLFQAVKSKMLAAFEREVDEHRLLEGLLSHLLAIILHQVRDPDVERLVAPLEVKRALALAPSDARGHAAWNLFDEMRRAEEPERTWREVVGPAFLAVWPMQADLRSEGTTLYLTWMAGHAGDAFPESVAAIAPALLPTARTNHSVFDVLDEERVDLYRRHPAAALALMDGLTDPDHPADDLAQRLEELTAADPSLRRDPRFERLWSLAARIRRRG